jgi:hypothetical protein
MMPIWKPLTEKENVCKITINEWVLEVRKEILLCIPTFLENKLSL